MGCLGILVPINDLLKAVLVFDQERDISIPSNKTKIESVLKIELQARTVLFLIPQVQHYRALLTKCLLH